MPQSAKKRSSKSTAARATSWSSSYVSARCLVFPCGRSASGKRDSSAQRQTPKLAFRPETVSAETKTQPQEPAICGLLGRLREISRLKTSPRGFEPTTRPL